jgi:hypothetical protein
MNTYTNKPGPIQQCNSRFKYCNINKKLGYDSGNVTIQGSTIVQRVSTLVNISRFTRNLKLNNANIKLNGYGQKSGGPYGYGSSPKNSF